MSATQQPWFPELKPFIKLEEVNDTKNPRVRIEILVPAEKIEWALKLTTACPACGDVINPVRARVAPNKRGVPGQGNHLYFAATCALGAKIGCSRGKAARDEYVAIVEAVRGQQ